MSIIAPSGHYHWCPLREHDFQLHACPDGVRRTDAYVTGVLQGKITRVDRVFPSRKSAILQPLFLFVPSILICRIPPCRPFSHNALTREKANGRRTLVTSPAYISHRDPACYRRVSSRLPSDPRTIGVRVLWWEIHSTQQILEARIGAQSIHPEVGLEEIRQVC